jgi:hypothetical protein
VLGGVLKRDEVSTRDLSPWPNRSLTSKVAPAPEPRQTSPSLIPVPKPRLSRPRPVSFHHQAPRRKTKFDTKPNVAAKSFSKPCRSKKTTRMQCSSGPIHRVYRTATSNTISESGAISTTTTRKLSLPFRRLQYAESLYRAGY